MAPLRVLALGNAYPPHHLGGYELIWRGVDRYLIETGHAVRVVTTTWQRDVATAAAPGPDSGVDVHRELDWYWHAHRWRELGWRARLALERHNAAVFARHLVEFRPDVLAWWPVGGLSLSLLEQGRRSGLPSVLFMLDPWLDYGPRHDLWLRGWERLGLLAGVAERVTRLPTRVRYDRLGRWVFCSESLRAATLAAHPSLGETVVLTPGLDRAWLELPEESEPPPWRGRLLYAGRVVEQKGVHTAIQALAQLPAGIDLTVLGDGDVPYRSRLEALVSELRLEGRVTFRPAVPPEALVECYREADAVVFPVEWEEPFGLVPLEAMAVGRPVIATGRGGSGDYLRGEENALLFGAGDANGLAAAVDRLGRDPALRERLRTAGRRTAQAHSETTYDAAAVGELERAAGCAPA